MYYKLPPRERDATLEQVRRVQAQVMRATNVSARLLERAEHGEMMTVMEVYEDIEDADGFARLLDGAVRDHLPAAHVESRRVERFRDA